MPASVSPTARWLLLSASILAGAGLIGCARGSGEATASGAGVDGGSAAVRVAGREAPESTVQVSSAGTRVEVDTSQGGAPAAVPSDSARATVAESPSADAAEPGLRILVSIAGRRLWLVDGADTLLKAPVAIGMGKDFDYNGRKYHFATPTGTRKVLAKAKDPLWTVPEWHYYEKAAAMGIGEVVRLEDESNIVLGDSSILTIRDHQVGRINHFGYFSPFTPGTEIVFDGRMYIPPISTAQRKVPNALGPYKLDMGDGYLIHGTHLYNEESIGDAVSHGCVRMSNEDLTRLYPLVPRGTPVIIF